MERFRAEHSGKEEQVPVPDGFWRVERNKDDNVVLAWTGLRTEIVMTPHSAMCLCSGLMLAASDDKVPRGVRLRE